MKGEKPPWQSSTCSFLAPGSSLSTIIHSDLLCSQHIFHLDEPQSTSQAGSQVSQEHLLLIKHFQACTQPLGLSGMPSTITLHQGDGMLLQLEEQAEIVLKWIS